MGNVAQRKWCYRIVFLFICQPVRAEALQSILQLMGEKDMYEYWSQTYRVHNLDWSQEKAALILDAWQRKFTQEIMRHTDNSNDSKNYKIHPFSSASLADILTKFSELSITRVAVGYVLMVCYLCFCFLLFFSPADWPLSANVLIYMFTYAVFDSDSWLTLEFRW